ncbi:Death on curing protein, Doc toxin [hydrothermal vent metagenome]|uniref:Death on curing protein, Doc toxin n=1 Tax=hydrothermal vent metagenome TaxID=652676 RepID=A0A3B1C6W5_9ZZZZ
MNLLLDTHVLIWSLENNATLSDIAREAIVDGENVVFVSAVSVWEISVKQTLGKLSVPDNLISEIQLHRFTPLEIGFHHAKLAGELPPIHKDPFDRMLIAQAMLEKLQLVTRDSFMSQYDVKILNA